MPSLNVYKSKIRHESEHLRSSNGPFIRITLTGDLTYLYRQWSTKTKPFILNSLCRRDVNYLYREPYFSIYKPFFRSFLYMYMCLYTYIST